jgi:hypothetical protein
VVPPVVPPVAPPVVPPVVPPVTPPGPPYVCTYYEFFEVGDCTPLNGCTSATDTGIDC